MTETSKDEVYSVKGKVVYAPSKNQTFVCDVNLTGVVADGDAVSIECPGLNSARISLIDPYWSTKPVVVLTLDTEYFHDLVIERRAAKVTPYPEEENTYVEGIYDGGK